MYGDAPGLGGTLDLVAPPDAGVDVIETADMKVQLRVDTADDDAYIASLVKMAVEFLDGRDGRLGRALITQDWKLSVPCFDDYSRIHIPLPPLQSVEEIQYYDLEETLHTADLADFDVFKAHDWAYIVPKTGKAWPGVASRPDAYQITFKAGFGDAASDIPLTVIQAIKLLVGHWYENREETTDIALVSIPLGAEALLARHRIGWAA